MSDINVVKNDVIFAIYATCEVVSFTNQLSVLCTQSKNQMKNWNSFQGYEF